MADLNEDRCPYCFNKFSDEKYTNDPILIENGSKLKYDKESGLLIAEEDIGKRKYKGFVIVKNKHITELQQANDTNKPTAGWTKVEGETEGFWTPNKQHIKELREAIEKGLGITEDHTSEQRTAILEMFFNYDDEGVERQTPHQKEWNDPKLTDAIWQGHITHMHLEDLRKVFVIMMEKWDTWKEDEQPYVILNGVMFKGDFGVTAWSASGIITEEKKGQLYLVGLEDYADSYGYYTGAYTLGEIPVPPLGQQGQWAEVNWVYVANQTLIVKHTTLPVLGAPDTEPAGSVAVVAKIEGNKFAFDISQVPAIMTPSLATGTHRQQGNTYFEFTTYWYDQWGDLHSTDELHPHPGMALASLPVTEVVDNHVDGASIAYFWGGTIPLVTTYSNLRLTANTIFSFDLLYTWAKSQLWYPYSSGFDWTYYPVNRNLFPFITFTVSITSRKPNHDPSPTDKNVTYAYTLVPLEGWNFFMFPDFAQPQIPHCSGVGIVDHIDSVYFNHTLEENYHMDDYGSGASHEIDLYSYICTKPGYEECNRIVSMALSVNLQSLSQPIYARGWYQDGSQDITIKSVGFIKGTFDNVGLKTKP
jgi:hypothetical protein